MAPRIFLKKVGSVIASLKSVKKHVQNYWLSEFAENLNDLKGFKRECRTQTLCHRAISSLMACELSVLLY